MRHEESRARTLDKNIALCLLSALFASALTLGFLEPHGLSNAHASGCADNPVTAQTIKGDTAFGGGTGVRPTPWIICSPAQLAAIGTNPQTLDGDYVLAANLDLGSSPYKPWEPIGSDSEPFTGRLDGAGYSISNIFGESNTSNYRFGLFEKLFTPSTDVQAGNYTEVKNLKISGQFDSKFAFTVAGAGDNFANTIYAGLLAAYSDSVIVSDVQITAIKQTGLVLYFGGLVGYSTNSKFERVKVDQLDIALPYTRSRAKTGGIFGYFTGSRGEAKKLAVSGTITGTPSAASLQQFYGGGIAGVIAGEAKVSEAVSEVNFTSSNRPVNEVSIFYGGIAGQIAQTNSSLSDSIVRNGLSNIARYGGLVGEISSSGPAVLNRNIILRSSIQNEMASDAKAFFYSNSPITAPSITDVFYEAEAWGAQDATTQLREKSRSFLQSILNFSGWPLDISCSASVTSAWNGTKVWKMENGQYPELVWLSQWPSTGPQGPTDVQSSITGSQSVILSWVAPANVGSSTITGYRIQSSTNGTAWATEVLSTNSLSTSTTLSSLNAVQNVQFRVCAITAVGESVGVAATAMPAVKFSSNYVGGPADELQILTAGQPTALAANVFTQIGYTFAGWNSSADGSGVSYTDEELVTITSLLELFAQWTPIPQTPPNYAGPLITSFSIRTIPADNPLDLTIRGERFNLVEQVFIGARSIEFERVSATEIRLSLPALRPGSVNLKMVYSSGATITHQDAFVVRNVSNSGVSEAALNGVRLSGFVGDSFRIPSRSKVQLSRAISLAGEVARVTCIGSTSGSRSTAADRRLALRRADQVCRLAKTLVPEAEFILRANPSAGIGSRYRAVEVIFETK